MSVRALRRNISNLNNDVSKLLKELEVEEERRLKISKELSLI